MLRPTFMGYEASKSALYTAQKAMDITGQNASNINTEGYTRQRADQVSVHQGAFVSRYSINMTVYAGMGTSIEGVQQLRNKQLDTAFRNEYCSTGYFDKKSTMLSSIEDIMQELDDGKDGNGYNLKYALQEVHKALQDFSSNANSPAQANVLATSFDNLSRTLNQKYKSLDDLQDTYIFEMRDKIESMNQDFAKIADLNKRIENSILTNSYTEQYGPNELLDERNLIIDNLSRMGELKVTYKDNGRVDISINGHMAVEGGEYDKLIYEVVENKATESRAVTLDWKSSGNDAFLGKGEIMAMEEVINGRGPKPLNSNENTIKGILYYRDKLDSLAQSLADTFNNILPQIDENKNIMKDENGNTMYRKIFGATMGDGYVDPDSKITGKNLSITNALSANSSYLIYDDDNRDNSYILSMLDALSTQKHAIGSYGDNFNGTFEDFINEYSVSLGDDLSYSDSQLGASMMVAQEIIDTRYSISGVSETEETTNMLVFNKAFQSASRMMTTFDSMLDYIVNVIGAIR
ncbi:MAG: flagellar hook-associated protein FlgK [Ruminococcus sp.]|jgi:flagellar hook-associated protein 1 FlgK|nr:flagellar hook-associated protein FlgK [Ruminococcus sp.]